MKKTGLILFTHNKFTIMRPLTIVSSIINFLQTGKMKNNQHLPTHTAITVVINDQLYVVDSDNDGLDIEIFEKWKVGRAWIQIFDPNIITAEKEQDFINKVLNKCGQKYGFADLGAMIKYLGGQKFKGQTNIDLADDSMICSVATAYFLDYKNWWKRFPLDLYKNRIVDAPLGIDLFAGKPEKIKIN